MGLEVTLVKSFAGASAIHLATIQGLGLKKFGQSRLLKDTPEIRGMIFKVKHLVSHRVVTEEPVAKARRKPKKIVRRDASRAKAEQQSK
ncbi:MAG TPA: 50S ribosomal protein L30 [Myxococcaceae bacterium]|nr:50S ribosomal protein L30 [Myxococcaceae bacterium]